MVTSGTVTVLGLPAGSRRCGVHRLLTQAPSIYADLTVRENVRYFARLYGLARTRPRDHPVGRARRPGRATGDEPLRRPAQPGLARLRAGRPAGGAGPGRADGRPGSGAARGTAGPTGLVVLIAVANAVLGNGARPAVQRVRPDRVPGGAVHAGGVDPQMLLCGLFVPRAAMAGWMEGSATPCRWRTRWRRSPNWAVPRTDRVMWRDLGIVPGVVVVALALGAATLRRRTP